MSEIKNSIKISFLSLEENHDIVRAVIERVLSKIYDVSDLSEIRAAVSEAVTNSIIHGYRDKVGKISVKLEIFDEVVKITIRDKGCGIENIEKAMEPCYSTNPDDHAGLGFSVMESFTDNVTITSEPDKGTTVILEKKITK